MLKLRLLTGPRAGRQLRVSDTKPVSIGRRKGRLRLHDSRVSKNHAEISFDDGLWVLRDLGSANGTYVNRQRVEGLVELESGDLLQVGRVLIKVVRCDGIGMDTQPDLSDGFADNDLLGVGAGPEAPGEEDGDLDLDALFSESDGVGPEPDDPIDELPPSDDADALDDAADDGDVFDDSQSTPDATNADEPVADDDSFMADLSDMTDTPGGLDLGAAATDDSQAEDEEEDDPFLSGSQHEPDDEDQDAGNDTSDQITLDDESGMGPRSAGTTLLSTVDHDELVVDDDAQAMDDAEDDLSAIGGQADDGDDDEAPVVVGLHLDQAPPQLPELADEREASVAEEQAEAKEPEDEVSEESTSESLLFDEDEPGSVNQTAIAAEADAEIASDDLGDETTPEVDSDHDLALEESEFLPDQDDDSSLSDETEDTFDEVSADRTESLTVSRTEDSDAPPANPVVEDEVQPELDDADDGPEFDIDAAFDALSEGLDDSVAAPSISDGSEDVVDVSGEHDAAPATDKQSGATEEDDPLVGSQLDVGFIRDALSQLEESEEDSTADAQDDSPKASATPASSGPPAVPELQTPPPGLNPTSLNPPADSNRAPEPPEGGSSGKGRWFFTLLLFLCVGGAGGFLISQNYEKILAVTGRGDDGSVKPTGQQHGSAPPSAQGDEARLVANGPAGQVSGVPQRPKSQEATVDGPAGPNPFEAGPNVLGADALQGITRGVDADRPPDLPGTANTQQPTPVVEPNRLQAGPDSQSPQGITSVNNPGVVPPVKDNTPPALLQPPARIVFLVDASGSLVDSLPQMVVWLNQALRTVEPDEKFAIYFFKAGKPIPVNPAGMLAPSRDLINQISKEWLNPQAIPVFPSGRSNPDQAIVQALSHEPTDLYLLSDDVFALSTGSTSTEQALARVNAIIAESEVRVHGVQFFYRGEESILESLANETKGTFEFVRERIAPDAEPIDLLEELGGE